MTRAWTEVRLGEVLTQRKEFVIIDDLATYKRPRVKLHAQGIILRDEVEGALIKTKKQQVCRAGEFLVAEIDAKVGGFGIVPDELDGAIVSSHYFLFDGNDQKLDRRFLDWYSKTPAFQEQVAAQGSTNYAAIRPDYVLAYTIPLPPLPEQRRIVARIEELAGKLTEARGLSQHANEEVEALSRASGNTLFEDVARRFGRTKLKVVTSRVTKGESPEWQGFSYQDTGPLFIRSENVLWGVLDPTSAVHIPEEFHRKLVRSQLRTGDVLITLVGASIGRACTVPSTVGEANVNQAVAVIRPNSDRVIPEFLVRFLLSPSAQDTIHGGKVETARPNISLGDLREIELPLAPVPEQLHIVGYLDALQTKMDELKRSQAETQKELDALMPSILDRAFKGKL